MSYKQQRAENLDGQIAALLSKKGALTEQESADVQAMIAEQDRLLADIGARPDTGSDSKTAHPISDPRFDAMENKFADLMNLIENSPAIARSGYVSQGGGTSDKGIYNLGDFALSLKRRDIKRLTEHYKSRPDTNTKDMSIGSGTTPFLIPEDMLPGILDIAAGAAEVRPRAFIAPVGSNAGRFPTLDITFTPNAGVGETALASQVTMEAVAEGATYGNTEPQFDEVVFNIGKHGRIVPVTEETLEDSPVAIEALLNRLIGTAQAAKEDYMGLRGVGTNEWLGWLNSPAAIGITPATNGQVSFVDVATMQSRFWSPQGGTPIWMYHPSVSPDFYNFEVGTGGSVWQANPAEAPAKTIDGWVRVSTQHLPQSTNSGAFVLVDWSSYIIFERRGMSLAVSDQADFQNGKVLFRWNSRSDGMPWLKAAITLSDPQGGFTQSPFVFHND